MTEKDYFNHLLFSSHSEGANLRHHLHYQSLLRSPTAFYRTVRHKPQQQCVSTVLGGVLKPFMSYGPSDARPMDLPPN